MTAWFKMEDDLPERPRIAAAGSSAGWLYVCGIAYCSRNLTDGFIPFSVAHRLTTLDSGVSCEEAAERLCDVELWEKLSGGYFVKKYLEHQKSRAEIEEKRKSERARLREFRDVRKSYARTTDVVRENYALLDIDVKELQKPMSAFTDNFSEEVQVVYDHWRVVWKKERGNYETITPPRRAAILARLREPRSVSDLCLALDGSALDPWKHRRNNNDLPLLMRPGNVDKFIALTEDHQSSTDSYPILPPGEMA